MDQQIEIALLSEEEPSEVQALGQVIGQSMTAFTKVLGHSPAGDEALKILTEVKAPVVLDQKYVFGIYLAGQMQGVADLLKAHPSSEVVTLDLFVISESLQKQGLGKKAFAELEDYIATWPSISKIQVSLTDPTTLAFWEKLGFKKLNASTLEKTL